LFSIHGNVAEIEPMIAPFRARRATRRANLSSYSLGE
jgi:hypothetical protein